MFKTLKYLTTLTLVTYHAQAQTILAIQAKCQVVQIGGRLSSYLPPKIGDILIIDTRKPIINDLTFLSRNNIPLLDKMKREPGNKTTAHIATYQAESRYPNGAQYSTTLQIARVSSGQTQATIQQLSRESAEALWTFGQLNLKCQ